MKTVRENIQANGTLAGSAGPESERREALNRLFVSHEVLDSDLINHYADYARQKSQLLQTAAEHDTDYATALATAMRSPSMSHLSDDHYREMAAVSVIARYLGTGTMILSVTPSGYQFSTPNSSWGGSGQPEPHFAEIYRAYTDFVPDPPFLAICERMKKRIVAISERAKRLRQDALELAESQALQGSCRYTTVK